MTSLRDQEKLAGDVVPLIVNVCNFAKAADGEPTLLSFEDARTLFHEFGQRCTAFSPTSPIRRSPAPTSPPISSNCRRSFTNTGWSSPTAARFARHYQTGEPMPEDLLQRLIAARNFNRALPRSNISPRRSSISISIRCRARRDRRAAFENKTLGRIGMPDEIVMRHRPPHFDHVFSGGGYAAAYYSYMWSEVLDADAFAAFEETGDIFDPETAKRLHDTIYAAGGRRNRPTRTRRSAAGCRARTRCCENAASLRRSESDLHSAGHRRGVVCAPHSAAVEAGRARSLPKAAMRSRRCWRWRRPSPPSIRT